MESGEVTIKGGLPSLGDVFVVPMGCEMYGAVRVIRVTPECRSAVFVVTPWFSRDKPSLDEPLLREILCRNRGFFRGEKAACNYEGAPPGELMLLGTILPSDQEASMDVQGAFGGELSLCVADDVAYEMGMPEAANSGARQRTRAGAGAARPAIESLSAADFWHVMDLIRKTENDGDYSLESAIAHLSAMSVARIAGFHDRLCSYLFELDQLSFAKEIGDGAYDSENFSVDQFLDARCFAILMGQRFYARLMKEPGLMPKNSVFEELVSLAGLAHEKKTGEFIEFHSEKSIETFSNKAGWDEEMGDD